MNWFNRLAKKSLIEEIRRSGWSEDQLRMDAIEIYQRNNQFFFSMGDWSNTKPDDLKGAIRNFHSGAEVSYDFESGPEGEGWDKIYP